jgi:hypothetical protein
MCIDRRLDFMGALEFSVEHVFTSAYALMIVKDVI